MALVLHTLCVMCCIVSLIYCVVIYYCFNDINRFLWYTGSYILFALHQGSLYSYFPYMLFGFGVDTFASNFYLSSYAAVSLFLCFGCIYLMGSSNAKLNRFLTAYGYFCMVIAALMVAVPGIYVPVSYIVVSVTGLVPSAIALYLSFRAFNMGIKRFFLSIVSYSFIFLASVLDPVFAFSGFEFTGLRIFAISFFALSNNILFTMSYKESISNTDTLTNSLNVTLEKLHHSNNALMFTRMNPDFLYSSLSLIRNKCDEDTFTAEELTVSLSKYLRQTLGFKQLKGIVPIGNEIELIKAYISIEKAKDPRLDFELYIPDDLPEFNIPPLSIQPLLENAICHAFPESMERGHITLEIEPSEDIFTISVTDDGIGMSEEQIKEALSSSREDGKVGINSIDSRLTALFSKGLTIISTPGEGTSVSFTVPKETRIAEEETV